MHLRCKSLKCHKHWIQVFSWVELFSKIYPILRRCIFFSGSSVVPTHVNDKVSTLVNDIVPTLSMTLSQLVNDIVSTLVNDIVPTRQ